MHLPAPRPDSGAIVCLVDGQHATPIRGLGSYRGGGHLKTRWRSGNHRNRNVVSSRNFSGRGHVQACNRAGIRPPVEEKLRLSARDIADEGLRFGTVRPHHVLAVIRNRNRCKDCRDRHHDHEFKQGETVRPAMAPKVGLHRVTHFRLASPGSCPQCDGIACVERTFA